MPLTLDACARPSWDRSGRVGSYFACGCVGFVAGVAAVVTLARNAGVPGPVTLAVIVTAPLALLVAVKLSHIVFGGERIVFYEKLLFVLAAIWLVLRLAGLPRARALDLSVLGIGVFLGFGRVGCLMVGCCHGRPARWGIRYRQALALRGYRLRQRLFPIQLVDGAASWICAGACAWWLARGATPGAPAIAYVTLYGLVRFVEEPFRGDLARPMVAGISEAQWTALVIALTLAIFVRSAPLVVAAALLSAGTLVLIVAYRRRERTSWGLTSARHVDELYRALRLLNHASTPMIRTSHGLRLSLRRVRSDDGLRLCDYVLSRPERPLTLATIAPLVTELGLDAAICAGHHAGVVHLVVRDSSPVAAVRFDGARERVI